MENSCASGVNQLVISDI